jgi:hypothetical protein
VPRLVALGVLKVIAGYQAGLKAIVESGKAAK